MNRRLLGGVLFWLLLTGFTFPDAAALKLGDQGEFEYRGHTVRLVERKGYRPVPEEWVKHALAGHQYPYDLEGLVGKEFPIYLTDREIVSRSGHAVAVTIVREVILFSGAENPNRPLVEETVLHEVAHVLAGKTMTDARWAEYRRVRDLGLEYRMDSPYWHRLPSEIFAEDFAHLFGTDEARQAAWKFPELPLPDEVPGLRDFFVGLVEPGAPLAEGRVSLSMLRTELSRLPGVAARLADLPWEGEGPATRAQAAYMISQALIEGIGEGDVYRSDLAQWPAWASLAIEQVQSHGLLSAKPDGRFAPDDYLDQVDAKEALRRLRAQRIPPVKLSTGGGVRLFKR